MTDGLVGENFHEKLSMAITIMKKITHDTKMKPKHSELAFIE